MAIAELVLSKEKGVATLTLNRPDKMNAMTTAMWEELQRTAEELRHDDEVRVLVLTGAGRAFCAGTDVEKRLSARIAGERLERTRAELLEPPILSIAPAIQNIGKPTIAAINGVAVGAGLSLALLCDLRIASEGARFAATWIRVGLVPDIGATYFLPRTVPIDKALQMFFTGDFIDAQEAERIGLVTQVVPEGELTKVTQELALRLAKGPSVALELIKRAVYQSLSNDLVKQLHFERYAQNLCYQTEDYREGVKAFMEKRQPVFKGE